MRRILKVTVITLVAVIPILAIPLKANAVPAFARQTGFGCTACHFQHYPALNAFGRFFKMGGFTMVGGEQAKNLVAGDILSMPSVLNASVVLKVRYQKTDGAVGDSGTNRGELQFPDEAALFLGGRVGEHVGFALEGQMADPDGPFFASFKIPFAYDVKGITLSLIPFTTDALGSSFGFELLNTGAVRNLRVFEHRKEISAQQYLGTAREATGVSFVTAHTNGYLNFTLWSPEHGKTDAAPYLKYIRLAVTPTIAGWDVGGGIQYWWGETKYGGTTRNEAEAWVVDAQAQGTIWNLPLGIYLTYGEAPKTVSSDTPNLFNSSTKDDKTAFTVLGELGIIPNRLTLGVGYRVGDTGASAYNKENAFTLGATYMIAQNVELQLNHSWYTGSYYDIERPNGERLTTLMLFTAF